MCPKGTYYCALHMVISHLRITHDSYTQNPDSYTWGLTGIEDLPHGESLGNALAPKRETRVTLCSGTDAGGGSDEAPERAAQSTPCYGTAASCYR